MGSTTEALGGADGGGVLRENSAVLLRYQMNAPPPITATKVKKTNRMPRQDFMGFSGERGSGIASGHWRFPLDPCGEGSVGVVAEGEGFAGGAEF